MILISNFNIFQMKNKEISSCILGKDFKLFEIINLDLQSIKCIIKTFNFVTKDVGYGRDEALRKACRYGHLKLVKYLVEKFNLT
jgi:hypothetical protein